MSDHLTEADRDLLEAVGYDLTGPDVPMVECDRARLLTVLRERDRLRGEAAGVRALVENWRTHARLSSITPEAAAFDMCAVQLERALASPPAPAAAPATGEALTLRVRTSSDGGPLVYLPRSRFGDGEHVEVRKVPAGTKPDGRTRSE